MAFSRCRIIRHFSAHQLGRLHRKSSTIACAAGNVRTTGRFSVDATQPRRHHHVQEEECILILPCDWRFLPKLGPRCLEARGPFLFYRPDYAKSLSFIQFRWAFRGFYCASGWCDAQILSFQTHSIVPRPAWTRRIPSTPAML